MTGFLEQLAGMATGDPAPGAAVSDLPPRFGWSPVVRPEGLEPTPAESAPLQAKTARADAPCRGTRSIETSTAAASSTARRDPAATQRPADVRPRRSEPYQEHETIRPALNDPPNAVGAATTADPRARLLTDPAEPDDPAAKGCPATASASDPVARALSFAGRPAAPGPADGSETRLDLRPVDDRSTDHPPDRPAPVRLGHGAQAPLSDAALAGRRSSAREPVVVQVTIDRLDVRAPAAQASTARPASEGPRRRPQPSVSLSDYLGGTDAGRGRL